MNLRKSERKVKLSDVENFKTLQNLQSFLLNCKVPNIEKLLVSVSLIRQSVVFCQCKWLSVSVKIVKIAFSDSVNGCQCQLKPSKIAFSDSVNGCQCQLKLSK